MTHYSISTRYDSGKPADDAPSAPPTYADLAALEPRLNQLLADAQDVYRRRGRGYDALAVFFGYGGCGQGFKRRIVALAGMCRRDGDPRLSTAAAYDVVYCAILATLEGRA